MEQQEELKEIKQKNESDKYLMVEDLVTRFFTSKGIVKAIDGVSFFVRKGEVYGLVGESGCGKSATATSIMDLVPDPPGRIVSGKVRIGGYNILNDLSRLAKIKINSETDVVIKRNKRAIKAHNKRMTKIRGNKMAMIFQEPSQALNPVLRIGDQISEGIVLHGQVEILNSILRREGLKDEDLNEFMKRLSKLNDPYEVRSEVNYWTRNNALSELEEPILNLVNLQADLSFKAKELIALVKSQQQAQDMNKIFLLRDFFYEEGELFDLKMKLDDLEISGSPDAERARQEYRAKEAEFKQKFGSLRYMIKINKKKYYSLIKKEARKRSIELLKLVNIAEPERVIDAFPHELSGGMQQRAMIAMALASTPNLLIADEPTTALDVTTQAQILDLIKQLNSVMGMAVLFITHDLAVIAEMCTRLGVMYAGNMVEESNADVVFANPKHPYTIGLLSSIPRTDELNKKDRLEVIPGSVPNLIAPPSGCRFHTRCKFRMDKCDKAKPKLVEIEEGHKVACFLYSEEVDDAVR